MGSGYPPGRDYPQSDVTQPGSGRPPIRLRMQLGLTIGQSWTMVGDVLTIGRAQDNDVVLDDPQVSRYHARLLRRALHTHGQGVLAHLKELSYVEHERAVPKLVHAQPR